MSIINSAWIALYRVLPESASYTLYKTALKINPKLVPEALRPKPIEPETVQEFLAALLLAFNEDPEYDDREYTRPYATLDGHRVVRDEILAMPAGDAERVILHNVGLKTEKVQKLRTIKSS